MYVPARFPFLFSAKCLAVILLLQLQLSISGQEALHTGQNEAQQQFDQVLLALSKGETSPLERLSLEHFISNIGRLDQEDQRIIRRRQPDLQLVLARLPAPLQAQRLQCIEILDQKCAAWLKLHATQNHNNPQFLSAISLFLPAERARNILQENANIEFDHGNMHSYLQIQNILRTPLSQDQISDNDQKINTHLQTRIRIAELLSGSLPNLYRPGLLTLKNGPLINAHKGLHVEWVIHNGYVHACDPWHTVHWQRALGKYSDIKTGPTHILIKDQQGFVIIDDRGFSTVLPNIPQAKSLSINAQHAWFAIKNTVYGYHIKTGAIISYSLPSPPLVAPLDDGTQQLWLCKHQLVHYQPNQQNQNSKNKHSVFHGLSLSENASLAHDGAATYIINNDRSLRIETYATSIAKHPARTLCADGRFQEAWDSIDNKQALAAQWLKADTTFISNNREALLELTYTTAEKALIWHRSQDNSQLQTQKLTAFNNAFQENPEQMLPMAANDYLQETFEHAISIRASLQQLQTATYATPWDTIKHQLQKGLSPLNSNSIPATEPQHRYAAQLQEDGDILVSCVDKDEHLLWYHRLPNSGYHPSLSLHVRNELLILTIGLKRTVALASANGVIRHEADLPGSYNDPKHVRLLNNNALCSLGPVGIYNSIFIQQNIDGHVHQQKIPLNSTAKWHLALGNIIIYSDGTQVRSLPNHQVVNFPEAIAAVENVSLVANGIQADNQLYTWKQ